MSSDHTKIPDFPKITAHLYDEHQGTVSVNGVEHPVQGQDLTQVRHAVLDHVVATAHKIGRAVKMTSTEADQSRWHLVVHPDGTLEEDQSTGSSPSPARKSSLRKKARAQPPEQPTPPKKEPPQPQHSAPVQEHVETPDQQLPVPEEPVYSHSANLWESAINEHNQERGYYQEVTLPRESLP